MTLAVTAGCGDSVGWLALPDVDEARGWLLSPGGQDSAWLDSEGITVPSFERGRLWALPTVSSSMAVASSPDLGNGQPLAVLATFRFEERTWAQDPPESIQVPILPERCAGQCLLYEPCPGCMFAAGTQTCGPCPVSTPDPAALPPMACPVGWSETELPDGHFSCAPAQIGGRLPCQSIEERWSSTDNRCVPIAPCQPPQVGPGDNAIYVDGAAAAGGDGSLAAPLREIPEPAANQTIVIAPGTYRRALRAQNSGVRLVGHGTCTILTAPSNEDVVHIGEAEVQIESLQIVATGTAGRGLIASSGSTLVLQDALLIGENQVLGSDGAVHATRSRFVRRSPCDGECEAADAAVHFRAVSTIEESDIEGPTALWVQQGGSTVRDVRLHPSPDGVGYYASGAGIFTVEQTLAAGGRIGMFFEAEEQLQVELTDVVVITETESDDAQFNVAISVLGEDQFLANLAMRRVFAQSAGTGIVVSYGSLDANEVHVDAKGRAVEALDNERIHSINLFDSWLQAGGEIIASIGSDVSLVNSWTRTCPECAWPEEPAQAAFNKFTRFKDVTPDTLTIRTAHVVAADRSIARGYVAVDFKDLTASGGGARLISATEADIDRLKIRATAPAIVVSTRAALNNIEVDVEGNTPALCFWASAQVSVSGFSIRTPQAEAPIAKAPRYKGAEDQVVDWRFSQGELPSGQLVFDATSSCAFEDAWPISPIFDQVRQR